MANTPNKGNAWNSGPKWLDFLWLVFLAAHVGVTNAAEEYLLGGGDTVQIMVYEQPDLSIEARLSQDNATIAYPLLGEVALGELTPAQAGRKIARLLKNGGFLKAPQVTVTVKDYLSKQIPIMGLVNQPGEYALRDEARVVDMIAQAGGLKEDAADVIVVMKKQGGKSVKHEIDLMRFYAGDMDQNIKISQGDLIMVPKMDTFFIQGEVNRPGMYRLERGMTAMQALSIGGGVNDRGSMKGLKVTRTLPDGSTNKINIELTDQLQPNDVLYVKERLF